MAPVSQGRRRRFVPGPLRIRAMVESARKTDIRKWRIEGCVFGTRPWERRAWIYARRSLGLNLELSVLGRFVVSFSRSTVRFGGSLIRGGG